MRRRVLMGLFVLLSAVAAVGAYAATKEPTDPDWMTTAKVKLALLEKLGADALEINVDTTDGRVTLRGDVEKRESKELAPRYAKSVEGVRSVESELRLEAGGAYGKSAAAEAEAEVKDAILESRLRIALIDALGTDGFKIGTEAASGVVLLEFDTDMPSATRQHAVRVAQALEGVSRVTTTVKD